MARILPATPDATEEAAQVLRGGGLVAFPTETVYGLGANALDADAVRKIFDAKGRPATNPLIVHVADFEQLTNLAVIGTRHAAPLKTLTDAFWPGPLTLVMPKTALVPDIVTAGGPTVAVRIPRHPVARALIAAAGVPLAAPSANRSEQLSPTRAEHVADSLGGAVDIILDGGPADVGLESTVLDLTEWPPRLLRPGMVTVAQIESVLGLSVTLGRAAASGPARSPGQMTRHYAPRTPLRVAADVWSEAAGTATPVAVLAHTAPPTPMPPSVQTTILPADPGRYAARLYDTLHRLDHLGASLILVQSLPETDDWRAVRDRLARMHP